MRKPLALSIALLSFTGVASADSVLLVSHQMQSVWHGYVVFLDGQRRSDVDGNAKRIGGVLPGRHELSVNLVSNPFKPNGKALCVGPIDVPDASEMRIKCEDNGGITVIGTTTFAPPPPPPPLVVVQTQDPRGDADELLAMAGREMNDAPPVCNRLRATVDELRFDLASRRRGRGGRHRLAFETNALADQAGDVCARSTVQLLRDAAAALAPIESAPPPMPQPVNADQLSGMRAAIAAAAPGRDRIVQTRRVTRGSWFTTRQITALLYLFSSSQERMIVLRDLAPRAVDPEVAGPVIDCFSTPGERSDAAALLSR